MLDSISSLLIIIINHSMKICGVFYSSSPFHFIPFKHHVQPNFLQKPSSLHHSHQIPFASFLSEQLLGEGDCLGIIGKRWLGRGRRNMIVGNAIEYRSTNSFEAPTLLIDIDIIYTSTMGNSTTHGNWKEFYTPNIWVLT